MWASSSEAAAELRVQSSLAVAFLIFVFWFTILLRILKMKNRMTARAFRAPRAILRTSLRPIYHEMHSYVYDFLYLLYDCGITPLWLADDRPIYRYFFPCTAKQIYQRAAFVTFSFILIPCKAKLIIYKSSILPQHIAIWYSITVDLLTAEK